MKTPMKSTNPTGINQWSNKDYKSRIMEAVSLDAKPGIIYKYYSQTCQRIELPNDPCWLHSGYIEKTGYTRMIVDGKRLMSHRYSWEVFNNQKIPKGLTIDHLCLTKHCINPVHLEVVTPVENDRRARFHYNARLEYCKKGHELKDPNIIYRKISSTRIDRRCRICQNELKRLSYHKTKKTEPTTIKR